MKFLAMGLMLTVCACATTPPAPASTLYSRLGERAGIAAALHQIVEAALKDPTLAAYFFFQTTTPPPEPGHPNRAQIEACLTEMLAVVAGGPGTYPLTLPDGYVCRDMKQTHKPLGIGNGEMSLFVAVANKTLTDLGVSPADCAAVVGALEGTRKDIVYAP